MINSKKLFFAEVLSRVTSVHLTKIDPISIDGFCGRGCMCELAAMVINRGYAIEFFPSDSNNLIADFTVSF